MDSEDFNDAPIRKSTPIKRIMIRVHNNHRFTDSRVMYREVPNLSTP